jgi:hypothetical protein
VQTFSVIQISDRIDPAEHRSEQPPRQVALGQHEPVVPGVLDQPPTRLEEARLEAGRHLASGAPATAASPRGFRRARTVAGGLRWSGTGGTVSGAPSLILCFGRAALVVEAHHDTYSEPGDLSAWNPRRGERFESGLRSVRESRRAAMSSRCGWCATNDRLEPQVFIPLAGHRQGGVRGDA